MKSRSAERSDRPALLVCSTGGHLAELYHLAPRLDIVGSNRLWVTFDTPQSRSLLADENHIFVRYTSPRDVTNTLLNAAMAASILRPRRFSTAISTGAAISLSFLPLARLMGCPAVYVESATRTSGPSLTGNALQRLPGVTCFTQHSSWADGKSWRFIGSVFDSFAATVGPPRLDIRRVVVMLGSVEGLKFSRLLKAVNRIMPANAEVTWQVGDTPADEVVGKVHRALPAHELERAVRAADVVVSHAGVGSTLTALTAGKFPILVPRLAAAGEHVDDHQTDVAIDLERRGLALRRDAESLCVEDLYLAAGMSTLTTSEPPSLYSGVRAG